MFHPLDLRNIDQPPDGLFLKNLSVRRKHFPQLESQQVRITVAGRRINRRLFRRRFAVQPARLEQNRNSAMGHDRIDLLAIERDHLSILALDIRARHERHTGAKRLPRPPQHVPFLFFTQEVHVPRVHVHRVHQASAMRRAQMVLKRFHGNPPVRFKRQKGRRNSLHLPARLFAPDNRLDFHVFAFANFSFSANSEFL